MNPMPPDNEENDEADALYRRLSAADPSRPDPRVHQNILEHAIRRAAQRSEGAARPASYSWQRAGRRWARPAAFGALAAAVLAVFLFGPRTPLVTGTPPAPAYDRAPAAAREDGAVMADIGADAKMAAPPPVLASAPAPQAQPAPREERDRFAPVAEPSLAAASAQASAKASAQANAQARLEAPRGEPRGGLPADAKAAADAAAPASVAASGAVANAPTAARRSSVAPAAAEELRSAAGSGDLAMLRELHARGVDLNAQDAQGRTALMLATLHGRSAAVAALLEYGADPNILDAGGESPLDAALAADESEIISALKRHGAR